MADARHTGGSLLSLGRGWGADLIAAEEAREGMGVVSAQNQPIVLYGIVD